MEKSGAIRLISVENSDRPIQSLAGWLGRLIGVIALLLPLTVHASNAPIHDFLSSTTTITTPFTNTLVAGTAGIGSTVLINGAPITVDEFGVFSAPVSLTSGRNPFAVTVVAANGDVRTHSRDIIRNSAISTAVRKLLYIDVVIGDAVLGIDGTAVYDCDNRNVLGFLPGEHIRGISPNQAEIYLASRTALSTATHQPLRTLPFSSEIPTNTFLVAPNGGRLYSGKEVVDVPSNRLAGTLPLDISTSSSGWGGASVAGGPTISPDGNTICTSGSCLDLASGNVIETTLGGSDIAFSPDGNHLLTSDYSFASGYVRIYSYPSFEEVRTISGVGDFAGEIGFLSDGTAVVGSSGNAAGGGGGVSAFQLPPATSNRQVHLSNLADNLVTAGETIFSSAGSPDETGNRFGINVLAMEAGTLKLKETYFLGVNAFKSTVGRPRQDQIRQIVFKAPFAVINGDYNANGVVDAADYTVWRDSVGLRGVGLIADANQNGEIDAGDYHVWRTNFGHAISNGTHSGISALPEPGALTVAMMATAAIMMLTGARGSRSVTAKNPPADGNGDFVVDAADYVVWRDHLGQSLSGGIVVGNSPKSIVPEPTVTMLLVAASIILLCRRTIRTSSA